MENDRELILRKVSQAKSDISSVSREIVDVQGTTFEKPLETALEWVKKVGGDVVSGNDNLFEWLTENFQNQEVFNSLDHPLSEFENRTVEVLVIKGHFIVAENGAIWCSNFSDNNGEVNRSLLFLAEQLVIVMDASEVVHNMHEAYERVKHLDFDYGTFISGPSKTADIEQSLVIGAQGPKKVWIYVGG